MDGLGGHFGERGEETTCSTTGLFSDYSMGLSMHGVQQVASSSNPIDSLLP